MKQSLANVLAQWGLEGANVTDLSKRKNDVARVYLLESNNKKFILKGYALDKEIEKIIYIQSVLSFIRDKSVTVVPDFLKTLSGDFVYRGKSHTWELSVPATGQALSSLSNNSQARNTGSILSILHASLAEYPDVFPDLIEEPKNIEQLKRRLHKIRKQQSIGSPQLLEDINMRGDISIFLQRTEVFLDYLLSLNWDEVEKALPKQLTHQDLHSEHFFFTNDEVTGIIDFAEMKYGCRLTDLASTISTLAPTSKEFQQNIVTGYLTHTKLVKEEVAALETFMIYTKVLSGLKLIIYVTNSELEIPDKDFFLYLKEELQEYNKFLESVGSFRYN